MDSTSISCAGGRWFESDLHPPLACSGREVPCDVSCSCRLWHVKDPRYSRWDLPSKIDPLAFRCYGVSWEHDKYTAPVRQVGQGGLMDSTSISCAGGRWFESDLHPPLAFSAREGPCDVSCSCRLWHVKDPQYFRWDLLSKIVPLFSVQWLTLGARQI